MAVFLKIKTSLGGSNEQSALVFPRKLYIARKAPVTEKIEE